MKVIVDINLLERYFELSGDVSPLLSNKRVQLYLKGYLHAYSVEENVRVPFEPENTEKVLINIKDIIQRIGGEFYPTLNAKTILDDFFREEENFIKFSQQANHIRNNELNQDNIHEFQSFTQILNKLLTKRVLYPLQLLSSYHLAFSQNACNFSVPGSGKTSIVYGAFAYLKSLPSDEPKKIEKLIIIGPLSSFGPWEDEYFECFGNHPNTKRISGGVSKRDRTKHFYSSHPPEITLLSYYSIPKVFDDLIYFIKKYKTMVVLDEAHKIKNVEGGIIATSVLSLAKYCRSRVVLTGTPAPNGYEDIDNLFQFIWPTKKIIPFNTYQLKDMSANKKDPRVKELIKSVSPYFIRIKKSDLGIPNPIEHKPIIIQMGSIQREIYDFIESKYMDYFLDQDFSFSGMMDTLVKARLIRLMQASTNPALLKRPLEEIFIEQGLGNGFFIDDSLIINKIMKYQENEIPNKFSTAGQMVKEILGSGGKVIVWAIFVQNILEFSKYLLQLGIENKTLYGATPVDLNEMNDEIDTREKIIREFHEPDSNFKVIVANPYAISESISLHKVCHNAIYIERSFNAAHFIQSKDRIHRYGLMPGDKVNYYYILSDNIIDRTIHERLSEKEKRMMEIIESEPIPLFQRLEADEMDDIRILINNYVKKNSLTR